MFNRTTQQASAIVLSLIFTAGILGSVDHLASPQAGASAVDHQVVVITAQKLPAPV